MHAVQKCTFPDNREEKHRKSMCTAFKQRMILMWVCCGNSRVLKIIVLVYASHTTDKLPEKNISELYAVNILIRNK